MLWEMDAGLVFDLVMKILPTVWIIPDDTITRRRGTH